MGREHTRARAILAELPPGFCRVVEVGVHRGALSAALLEARSDLMLYMVDSWTPTPVYRGDRRADRAAVEKVIERYLMRVIVVAADSLKAATLLSDHTFDLVFIDADHSYEAVRADILAWRPKVKRGGVLGGHDYRSDEGYGVIQAVNELIPHDELRLGANLTWFTTIR